MNFEFSEEMQLLRDQARRFLGKRCPPAAVRCAMERQQRFERALWADIAQMGWLGAAVPKIYGGAELGYEGLCVLAEELGRALAPMPFSSSVCLATEAVLRHGTEVQKAVWLPRLVSGKTIGAFAFAEGPGNPRADALQARVSSGCLSGTKWPVLDGGIADIAVVAARDEAGQLALYLVELAARQITRTALDTIDPSREQTRLDFDCARAARLPVGATGWDAVESLLDSAAVLIAFEQLGGATASLEMALAYAKTRVAFGRPIGSFQAIKHKLADVYIASELARSNAYYGAWALSSGARELPLAASAARVSSTDAYHLASKENIQTHGGMGITWEVDCHLHYRRAKMLSLQLGSIAHWKDRLMTHWAAAPGASAATAT
jgi:acyl-CoA dehydrogenase